MLLTGLIFLQPANTQSNDVVASVVNIGKDFYL